MKSVSSSLILSCLLLGFACPGTQPYTATIKIRRCSWLCFDRARESPPTPCSLFSRLLSLMLGGIRWVCCWYVVDCPSSSTRRVPDDLSSCTFLLPYDADKRDIARAQKSPVSTVPSISSLELTWGFLSHISPACHWGSPATICDVTSLSAGWGDQARSKAKALEGERGFSGPNNRGTWALHTTIHISTQDYK